MPRGAVFMLVALLLGAGAASQALPRDQVTIPLRGEFPLQCSARIVGQNFVSDNRSKMIVRSPYPANAGSSFVLAFR